MKKVSKEDFIKTIRKAFVRALRLKVIFFNYILEGTTIGMLVGSSRINF